MGDSKRMDKERRNSGLEEFVYRTLSERIHVSEDEFMEGIKQWELKPVEVFGTLAAVVMVKDNEVHVAVDPEYKGRWMKRGSVIRGILAGILEKHGEIVTSVSYGNDGGKAFVERLGFVPDSVTYRLEKLTHA